MMIYSQDRSRIVKVGKQIYICHVPEAYLIQNRLSDDEVITLGEYDSHEQASKVLKTIFKYLRCKRDTYCMPDINEFYLSGGYKG